MYVNCISDWAYVTVNIVGIVVITVGIIVGVYIATRKI